MRQPAGFVDICVSGVLENRPAARKRKHSSIELRVGRGSNGYKELGPDGLHDQSRRPLRYANQLPFQVERRILAIM